MKIRSKVYGDSNLIGANIEKLRKERGIKQKDFIAMLQVAGLDINPTSYSKLEGQLGTHPTKKFIILQKS